MKFVYATLGSLIAFLLIMLSWYYVSPVNGLKAMLYCIILLGFVLVFFMGRLSQREEYHQVYFMSAPFALAIAFYFLTLFLGLENQATKILLLVVMMLFLVLGVGLVVISQGKQQFTYTIAGGFALLVFLAMFAYQNPDNLPNQNQSVLPETTFLTPFPHTDLAKVHNGTVTIPFKSLAEEAVTITSSEQNKGDCGSGEVSINVTDCTGQTLEQIGVGNDFCIIWYCTTDMTVGEKFKATLAFSYEGELRDEITGTIVAVVE